MSFPKITQEDLANRGVTGLPDTPNYSTADMQRKFDELSLDVLVPKYNALVESLMATDAAANIGAKMPAVVGLESEDATIQTVLDTVAHLHNNKKTLDKLTEDADGTPLYDGKFLSGDAFASITVGGQSVTATNTDNLTLIAGDNIVIDVDSTEKTVKFTSLGGGGTGGGGGDMFTAVYDKNKDGIVDNASALGGNAPSYYQSAESEDLNTTEKNIVDAINEVKGVADEAKETADAANAKEVDALTTMEQVDAATDPSIPVGAGAIQELSENFGSYYDEETDTLYIQGGTSNYTYDSDTETLYIG